MTEIVFDGKKIEVAKGTNLVEAGLLAGVPVPVFCYHKDLGAVGSCRVCAVTVTQQGKARTVMACMTEAQDGMQVTTLDPDSVKLRKYVIEWLMESHPHDCPICDEGGECQLQDLTVAGGHSIRRFRGKKRTFRNQYLGEFIVHEMNRCIACYRCSRFYQEVAGGRDFGVTGSRNRVYFGRFEDGPLESPFSGNLIEFCPTGVFTDKLFRYKSRVWDLEIAPSVCPHCSVGCNVHPGARHRELQRVRVRDNPAVNGVFLCDRGQFGHGFVMASDRPRQVRMRGEPTDWENAFGLAGGALLAIARSDGPGSIALITSPRASVETHVALESLAVGPLEGARVSHFDEPGREQRSLAALHALASAGTAPLEQSDLARRDVLLVAGASLVDEAPLAALAARQMARQGGRLFVLGGPEHYLGDVAERIVPVHPAKLGDMLNTIAKSIGGNGSETTDDASSIASALRAAEHPGILLGTDLNDRNTIAAGAGVVSALKGPGQDARLGYVFPRPNAFGAAALSRGASLAGILADLEAGKLRALVVAEAELDALSREMKAALSKLELLIVLDYLNGTLLEHANVFLPTTAPYESESIYVNRAGRAQATAPARAPGLSVIELIDHETFPRQARRAPPEGDARPAWWALEMLRERAVGQPTARRLGEIRDGLRRSHSFWNPLYGIVPGDHGHPLDPSLLSVSAPSLGVFATTGKELALFRMERTLGSEPLSRRSLPITKMAGPPRVWLSPSDAKRLGVNGEVSIELVGGSVTLGATVSATVAEGTVIAPRDVAWPVPIEQGTPVRVTPTQPAGAFNDALRRRQEVGR